MPCRSAELGTSVREALLTDAQRIASLAGQMGYEVSVAHVERQLERVHDEHAILVAVVPRAGVVGWIGIALREAITHGPSADVDGLVVEDEYRGNGIGEMLIGAAETWARRHGCGSLRVRSNVVRERAHAFYNRLGYEVVKTQHVFTKPL